MYLTLSEFRLDPPLKCGMSSNARGKYSRQMIALDTFNVVAQEHDLILGVIYGACYRYENLVPSQHQLSSLSDLLGTFFFRGMSSCAQVFVNDESIFHFLFLYIPIVLHHFSK